MATATDEMPAAEAADKGAGAATGQFLLPGGEVVDRVPDSMHLANPKLLHEKRFKFQVLGGGHLEPVPVLSEDGHYIIEPVEQFGTQLRVGGKPSVRIAAKDRVFGPGRPAGDIVASDVDLAKRFNRRGTPPKFRPLGRDGDARTEELASARVAQATAEQRERRLLKGLPVRQLIEYAEAEEIDLRGETKKEAVMALIEAHNARQR